MTGGIAYVLDETGQFSSVLCNQASVDLEPVEAETDVGVLRDLIERHLAATGSPRARWVLEHWQQLLGKFVKVFPHELKRVMGVPRKAARPAAAETVPSVVPAAQVERPVLHG
jgi:glutamate synthase domain-containing protein 3